MITRQQAIDALDRHDNEIAQRLREGQQDYERTIREAKEIRDALIIEALESGWSMSKVGAVLGLSKQRIAQIRNEVQS